MKLKLLKAINQTSCQACGFSDIRALCFHHRNPTEKSFDIKWAFAHSYSFKTILNEVKKCDVLCSNCHTIFHCSTSKAAEYRRKIKERIFTIIGRECLHCGFSDIRSMSCHHRDPKTKRFKISNKLTSSDKKELIKEAKKCDPLCMNCHFIFHYYEAD